MQEKWRRQVCPDGEKLLQRGRQKLKNLLSSSTKVTWQHWLTLTLPRLQSDWILSDLLSWSIIEFLLRDNLSHPCINVMAPCTTTSDMNCWYNLKAKTFFPRSASEIRKRCSWKCWKSFATLQASSLTSMQFIVFASLLGKHRKRRNCNNSDLMSLRHLKLHFAKAISLRSSARAAHCAVVSQLSFRKEKQK